MRVLVGDRRLNKVKFMALFYNRFGSDGSLWNQLGELYLPVISAIDLGMIMGDRVFCK